MSIVGLDIGGTKIEGVLSRGGRIVASEKARTPRNARALVALLVKLAGMLRGKDTLTGAGLAVAGAMDFKAKKILQSPNLKFLNGVVLGKLLEKRLRVPVRMDNDVNCFLRAEARFGHARGKKNVVALTLGTGVGGAVLVDENVVHGKHGAAGELGHIVIALLRVIARSETTKQSHGRKEIVSSARGGLAMTNLTLEDLVSSHGFLRLGVTDPLDCQNKAFAGDKKSLRIYDQIGRYLGVGLATLVNIFDPELIILGGGISRARWLLTKPAEKEMRKHTLLPPRLLPPIKISKLKYAGALGAVALFLK